MSTPLTFPELENRLASFANLKRGWDSYDADPPSYDARIGAWGFLHELKNHKIIPAKLNPSVVGGVGFTFRLKPDAKRWAYVEFRNTGNAHVAWSLDGQVTVNQVCDHWYGDGPANSLSTHECIERIFRDVLTEFPKKETEYEPS